MPNIIDNTKFNSSPIPDPNIPNTPPPTPKNIYLIISIILIVVVLFGLIAYFVSSLSFTRSANPINQSTGMISPTRVPAQTTQSTNSAQKSIQDLIKNRTKIDIDISAKNQKGQNTLESVKSVNFHGKTLNYFRLIPEVYASTSEETATVANVPQVIFQDATDEETKKIAATFGFTNEPTKPDHDPRILKWKAEGKELIINSYSINYAEYQEGQTAPSYESAQKTAIDYLTKIGYLPSAYDIYNVFPEAKDTAPFSKDSPYSQKYIPATSVGLVTKYAGIPISYGDLSAKFYGTDINAFPQIYTWVGGDNKVVSASIPRNTTYKDTGLVFTVKTEGRALADLKATGGIFMNVQYLGQEKDGSSCFGNKCNIKDAEINNIKLVYYSSFPGGKAYTDDFTPHTIGYLTPMYLMSGKGTMVRTVDGTTTYDSPVNFIAGIYAITEDTESKPFLKIGSLDLADLNAQNMKASINVTYDLPAYNGLVPNPRQGVDYTILVLYPDNTYAQYRSVMYDANGSEELTIPKKSSPGVKIVAYLTDFPSVSKQADIEFRK